MTLYEDWCDTTKETEGHKHYWSFVEKADGRDEICDALTETMRSHYDRLDRIADDVARLGYVAPEFQQDPDLSGLRFLSDLKGQLTIG